MSADLTSSPDVPAEDSPAKDLYYWLQAMVVALTVLVLLFTFVGRIIGVNGSSMVPTLEHNDMVLLRSIFYTPKQGDVVVLHKAFASIDQPIIKRVIAVGGQTIRVDQENGVVYVDDEVVDEPYLGEAMCDTGDPYKTNLELTVPEGSVYVMGDNRNASSDSRDVRLGTVDERYILGKALCVIFPFRHFGAIH